MRSVVSRVARSGHLCGPWSRASSSQGHLLNTPQDGERLRLRGTMPHPSSRQSQPLCISAVSQRLATGVLTGPEGLRREVTAVLVVGPEVALGSHVRLPSSCLQIRHLRGSGSRLQQFLEALSVGRMHSLGDARTRVRRSQAHSSELDRSIWRGRVL